MKTALILEGGGMRGLYTNGVLDYFLNQNLEFDMVTGVSAGAGCACSYLSKQFGRGATINIDYMQDKEYFSMRNLFRYKGAFNMKMMFTTIPNSLNRFDYKTFHNNPTVFYAVCTDIETGKPFYKRIINMRSDYEYLQASMSLPFISSIVEKEGRKLLDGGISDSIPYQFAFDQGYDKCVVVLTQCSSYKKGKNNLIPLMKTTYRQYPKMIQAMENRHIQYNESLEKLYELEKQGKVFIIQPQKSVDISRLEKNPEKLRKLYHEGYHDCEVCFSKLLQYLKSENSI